MGSSSFPLEIQELRRPGNVYKIHVKWFTSIKDIKDQLHKETNYPPSRMQIYHSSSSKSLRNQTTLHDLGIVQAGFVLHLALVFNTAPQYLLLPSKDICLDTKCEGMLREVRAGLRSGHLPGKTDMLDCTGGVYFMKGSANTKFAVFKPNDEEQGMPNNPKGHAGNGDHGLRSFLKPGEGYIRETAAYILDKDNFCNVPPTTIVHCEHDAFHYPRKRGGQNNMYPKLGSLQKFIPSSDTFDDISPSLVGVLELQKIALLDMRLLNGDRNASNILAIRKPPPSAAAFSSAGNTPNRKYSRSSSVGTSASHASSAEEMDLEEFFDRGGGGGGGSSSSSSSAGGPNSSRYSDQYSLIPIDHGYCIPSQLHIDELDWAWFYCPHVEVEVQPQICEYINSIDLEQQIADLTRQVPMSEDQLFLLRVAHGLIKEGVNTGLSLREIAELIARTDEDVPSPLENAIAAAEDNAQRIIEARSGRRGGGTTSPSFRRSLMEQQQQQQQQQDSAQSSTHASPLHNSVVANSPAHDAHQSPSAAAAARATNVALEAIATAASAASAASAAATAAAAGSGGTTTPPSSCSPSGFPSAGILHHLHSTAAAAAAPSGSPTSSAAHLSAGAAGAGAGAGAKPFPLPRCWSPDPVAVHVQHHQYHQHQQSPAAAARHFLPPPPPHAVCSELNLEAIGETASSAATAIHPPPTSFSSEGCSSGVTAAPATPPPVEAEEAAGNAQKEPILGYLSSENIQKLQNSPSSHSARHKQYSESLLLMRRSLSSSGVNAAATTAAASAGTTTTAGGGAGGRQLEGAASATALTAAAGAVPPPVSTTSTRAQKQQQQLQRNNVDTFFSLSSPTSQTTGGYFMQDLSSTSSVDDGEPSAAAMEVEREGHQENAEEEQEEEGVGNSQQLERGMSSISIAGNNNNNNNNNSSSSTVPVVDTILEDVAMKEEEEEGLSVTAALSSPTGSAATSASTEDDGVGNGVLLGFHRSVNGGATAAAATGEGNVTADQANAVLSSRMGSSFGGGGALMAMQSFDTAYLRRRNGREGDTFAVSSMHRHPAAAATTATTASACTSGGSTSLNKTNKNTNSNGVVAPPQISPSPPKAALQHSQPLLPFARLSESDGETTGATSHSAASSYESSTCWSTAARQQSAAAHSSAAPSSSSSHSHLQQQQQQQQENPRQEWVGKSLSTLSGSLISDATNTAHSSSDRLSGGGEEGSTTNTVAIAAGGYTRGAGEEGETGEAYSYNEFSDMRGGGSGSYSSELAADISPRCGGSTGSHATTNLLHPFVFPSFQPEAAAAAEVLGGGAGSGQLLNQHKRKVSGEQFSAAVDADDAFEELFAPVPIKTLHAAAAAGATNEHGSGGNGGGGDGEGEYGINGRGDGGGGGGDKFNSTMLLHAMPPAIPLSSMSRVTSFAAFESPLLYDLPKSERQLARLKQERRKAMSRTAEFQQLRSNFAHESVLSMVTKLGRVKARSEGRSLSR